MPTKNKQDETTTSETKPKQGRKRTTENTRNEKHEHKNDTQGNKLTCRFSSIARGGGAALR